MLRLETSDVTAITLETLIIPVCEDCEIHTTAAINALCEKARTMPEFSGKTDERIVFYQPDGLATERVILMGSGPRKDITPETLRSLTGRSIRHCIKKKLPQAALLVPDAKQVDLDEGVLLEAILEGACLANNVFDRYKGEKKHSPLDQMVFFVTAELAKREKDLPLRVEAVCNGTLLAREWINTPANEKPPERFAAEVIKRARSAGLQADVMDHYVLAERKFGAILAVGAGSSHPPRLVTLEYSGKNPQHTVALIGKGVTFDSGGINLKRGDALTYMKTDMSGAAVVAATMITVARLGLPLRVIGLIPMVENMVSGLSTRPGDIISTYSGKTVEVGNTDAEGRLIMADALAFGIEQFNPDLMIDMATLTGACVVALGEKIAGVFTPDDQLAAQILAAADKTHERCWRMPMPKDYAKLLKSPVADINNMPSTRSGGAITAALFLAEFVGKTRWAHIDIAGPSYSKKASDCAPAGATGFGVRLLWEILRQC